MRRAEGGRRNTIHYPLSTIHFSLFPLPPSAFLLSFPHCRRSGASARRWAACRAQAIRLRRRSQPRATMTAISATWAATRKMPWQIDGRRWHTVLRVRADRQSLPLGRTHPGRGRRSHTRAVQSVRRDRLERQERGRDSCGQEIRRLVFSRYHGRGVAAEDEVPHCAKHVPARRIDRAAGTKAAQRHARVAAVRPRAAGAVPQPARPLAGSRVASTQPPGDQSPGVLGFCRSRGGGLRKVHGKHSSQIRYFASLETAWPHLAFCPPRFSLGKKIHWDVDVLEQLVELLAEAAPQGQFLWNNKQVVPVYLPQRRAPWAAVQTKKLDAVYLHLMGPKGRFTLGQITELGHDPQVDGDHSEVDSIRLKFRTTSDLVRGDLRGFLRQHLAASS